MPQPSLYNDGNVNFGSSRVTVSGVQYVAEDITLTIPTNLIERRDQSNARSGFVITQAQESGSMTLQTPSGNQFPGVGYVFSPTTFVDIILPASVTAHPWAITSVAGSYSQAGVTKANVGITYASQS